MDTLPADLWGHIASYSALGDFRNFMCTCKYANQEIGEYPQVWYNLYKVRFNYTQKPKRNFTDWKKRMGIMVKREFEAWFWNITKDQVKDKITEQRTLFEGLRMQYHDMKVRLEELRQHLSDVHEQYEYYRTILRWKNSTRILDDLFGWIEERPRIRNKTPRKRRKIVE